MVDFVRGSISPPQSLGLKLTVMSGRNQIQRQLGNFGALYSVTGSNMQEAYFELEADRAWISNPQDTFSQLVISTSGTVMFEGTLPDASVLKFPINKLTVLDTAFTSFSITNEGTERVRGCMNFVSKMTEMEEA